MREMSQVSPPTRTSGFFQISSSIDNVKHIFVYLKIVAEMLMIIGKLKAVHTQ